MKYFLLAVVAGVIVWFLANRQAAPEAGATAPTPVAANTPTPAPASTPRPGQAASDHLKRPLDRTKEVLKDVNNRNGAGEF